MGAQFSLRIAVCLVVGGIVSQVIWSAGLQLQTVWNVVAVVSYTFGLRGQGSGNKSTGIDCGS